MEQGKYHVYVKTDEENRITAINSSAFLSDVSEWIQVDEGYEGERYGHAQMGYLEKPLYTSDGYAQYKLSDGAVIERSQEELDTDRLPVEKDKRIAQSKADLASYLIDHPIQWTDGECYSITEEKQNQLMGTLMAAQLDGKKPEWNTTGGVCKEWELSELTTLAVAIKDRVKALVKYQQTQELAMYNARTLQELEAIEVDYSNV